jgi:hypothetical protein
LEGLDSWIAHDDLTFAHRSFSLFGGGLKRDLVASGMAAVGRRSESRGSLGTYPLPAAYFGIPATYDLDLSRGHEPRSTVITVRAHKSRAATLTAGGAAAAQPSGRLALFAGGAAGGELAALSRAEVYFDRSEPRRDGAAELANLYSPYWRVRLVPPTLADKVVAASLQAGVMLP